VFVNKVQRIIFGPKRGEVTGDWRKLYNEELHNVYEMGRECSTNGEKRNAYRILVGKPDGKRPIGRPRCRWLDNIKMDLGETEWGVWTGFIWHRIGTNGGLM
jgi:hypothetical protein